ncbi:MAG: glycogen/starch synthase, partial [Candidatus Omnitrophota bacterium]
MVGEITIGLCIVASPFAEAGLVIKSCSSSAFTQKIPVFEGPLEVLAQKIIKMLPSIKIKGSFSMQEAKNIIKAIIVGFPYGEEALLNSMERDSALIANIIDHKDNEAFHRFLPDNTFIIRYMSSLNRQELQILLKDGLIGNKTHYRNYVGKSEMDFALLNFEHLIGNGSDLRGRVYVVVPSAVYNRYVRNYKACMKSPFLVKFYGSIPAEYISHIFISKDFSQKNLCFCGIPTKVKVIDNRLPLKKFLKKELSDNKYKIAEKKDVVLSSLIKNIRELIFEGEEVFLKNIRVYLVFYFMDSILKSYSPPVDETIEHIVMAWKQANQEIEKLAASPAYIYIVYSKNTNGLCIVASPLAGAGLVVKSSSSSTYGGAIKKAFKGSWYDAVDKETYYFDVESLYFEKYPQRHNIRLKDSQGNISIATPYSPVIIRISKNGVVMLENINLEKVKFADGSTRELRYKGLGTEISRRLAEIVTGGEYLEIINITQAETLSVLIPCICKLSADGEHKNVRDLVSKGLGNTYEKSLKMRSELNWDLWNRILANASLKDKDIKGQPYEDFTIDERKSLRSFFIENFEIEADELILAQELELTLYGIILKKAGFQPVGVKVKPVPYEDEQVRMRIIIVSRKEASVASPAVVKSFPKWVADTLNYMNNSILSKYGLSVSKFEEHFIRVRYIETWNLLNIYKNKADAIPEIYKGISQVIVAVQDNLNRYMYLLAGKKGVDGKDISQLAVIKNRLAAYLILEIHRVVKDILEMPSVEMIEFESCDVAVDAFGALDELLSGRVKSQHKSLRNMARKYKVIFMEQLLSLVRKGALGVWSNIYPEKYFAYMEKLYPLEIERFLTYVFCECPCGMDSLDYYKYLTMEFLPILQKITSLIDYGQRAGLFSPEAKKTASPAKWLERKANSSPVIGDWGKIAEELKREVTDAHFERRGELLAGIHYQCWGWQEAEPVNRRKYESALALLTGFQVPCGLKDMINVFDDLLYANAVLIKKSKNSPPSLPDAYFDMEGVYNTLYIFCPVEELKPQELALKLVSAVVEAKGEKIELQDRLKEYLRQNLLAPRKLRVVLISPECRIIRKRGGLGDVVWELAEALAELGHEVIVFTYASVRGTAGRTVKVDFGGGSEDIQWCKQIERSNITVYTLWHEEISRKIYSSVTLERAVVLSKVTLEVLRILKIAPPDVVHGHDWMAALAMFYMCQPQYCEYFNNTARLFTVHNGLHQGVFAMTDSNLRKLGLKYWDSALEFYGELNLLKTGIVCANIATTVSRDYAHELTTWRGGGRLSRIVAQKGVSFGGIDNGIDLRYWDPAVIETLPYKFNQDKVIEGKAESKRNLIRLLGVDTQKLSIEQLHQRFIVITLSSRLDKQKGVRIFSEAIRPVLRQNQQVAVFIVGQEYDKEEVDYVRELFGEFPLRVYLQTEHATEDFMHLLYAGSDIWVVPSMREPFGIGARVAAKCFGNIVVVHWTGGLRVLKKYDLTKGQGNVLGFDKFNSAELLTCIERALLVYKNPEERWRLVRKGMKEIDVSWQPAVIEYTLLYEKALKQAGNSFSPAWQTAGVENGTTCASPALEDSKFLKQCKLRSKIISDVKHFCAQYQKIIWRILRKELTGKIYRKSCIDGTICLEASYIVCEVLKRIFKSVDCVTFVVEGGYAKVKTGKVVHYWIRCSYMGEPVLLICPTRIQFNGKYFNGEYCENQILALQYNLRSVEYILLRDYVKKTFDKEIEPIIEAVRCDVDTYWMQFQIGRLFGFEFWKKQKISKERRLMWVNAIYYVVMGLIEKGEIARFYKREKVMCDGIVLKIMDQTKTFSLDSLLGNSPATFLPKAINEAEARLVGYLDKLFESIFIKEEMEALIKNDLVDSLTKYEGVFKADAQGHYVESFSNVLSFGYKFPLRILRWYNYFFVEQEPVPMYKESYDTFLEMFKADCRRLASYLILFVYYDVFYRLTRLQRAIISNRASPQMHFLDNWYNQADLGANEELNSLIAKYLYEPFLSYQDQIERGDWLDADRLLKKFEEIRAKLLRKLSIPLNEINGIDCMGVQERKWLEEMVELWLPEKRKQWSRFKNMDSLVRELMPQISQDALRGAVKGFCDTVTFMAFLEICGLNNYLCSPIAGIADMTLEGMNRCKKLFQEYLKQTQSQQTPQTPQEVLVNNINIVYAYFGFMNHCLKCIHEGKKYNNRKLQNVLRYSQSAVLEIKTVLASVPEQTGIVSVFVSSLKDCLKNASQIVLDVIAFITAAKSKSFQKKIQPIDNSYRNFEAALYFLRYYNYLNKICFVASGENIFIDFRKTKELNQGCMPLVMNKDVLNMKEIKDNTSFLENGVDLQPGIWRLSPDYMKDLSEFIEKFIKQRASSPVSSLFILVPSAVVSFFAGVIVMQVIDHIKWKRWQRYEYLNIGFSRKEAIISSIILAVISYGVREKLSLIVDKYGVLGVVVAFFIVGIVKEMVHLDVIGTKAIFRKPNLKVVVDNTSSRAIKKVTPHIVNDSSENRQKESQLPQLNSEKQVFDYIKNLRSRYFKGEHNVVRDLNLTFASGGIGVDGENVARWVFEKEDWMIQYVCDQLCRILTNWSTEELVQWAQTQAQTMKISKEDVLVRVFEAIRVVQKETIIYAMEQMGYFYRGMPVTIIVEPGKLMRSAYALNVALGLAKEINQLNSFNASLQLISRKKIDAFHNKLAELDQEEELSVMSDDNTIEISSFNRAISIRSDIVTKGLECSGNPTRKLVGLIIRETLFFMAALNKRKDLSSEEKYKIRERLHKKSYQILDDLYPKVRPYLEKQFVGILKRRKFNSSPVARVMNNSPPSVEFIIAGTLPLNISSPSKIEVFIVTDISNIENIASGLYAEQLSSPASEEALARAIKERDETVTNMLSHLFESLLKIVAESSDPISEEIWLNWVINHMYFDFLTITNRAVVSSQRVLLPRIRTKYGVYQDSPPEAIASLDKVIDLKPGMEGMDLGCGRGWSAFGIASLYGVSMEGYDLNEQWFKEIEFMRFALECFHTFLKEKDERGIARDVFKRLLARVNLRQGDALLVDCSRYDFIYSYLPIFERPTAQASFNKRVGRWLSSDKGLKPGALFVILRQPSIGEIPVFKGLHRKKEKDTYLDIEARGLDQPALRVKKGYSLHVYEPQKSSSSLAVLLRNNSPPDLVLCGISFTFHSNPQILLIDINGVDKFIASGLCIVASPLAGA